jgi:hypothetical protein
MYSTQLFLRLFPLCSYIIRQGYLFDRRQSKKHLRAAWGMECDEDALTTCVRRFGRRSRSSNAGERERFEHITGARMPSTNGHEVSCLNYFEHRL